jgi:Rap1a immunity proteins
MNALAGFRAKLAKVSSRVSVEFVQMFRIVFVALVLSGFILKGPAMAEVIDGAKLFADCRDGDDPNARDSTHKGGMCFGYINGVADALVPAGAYCLPPGASAGQVLDVAKLYIQDHPDKRYMSAPQLIVNALTEKFPCN